MNIHSFFYFFCSALLCLGAALVLCSKFTKRMLFGLLSCFFGVSGLLFLLGSPIAAWMHLALALTLPALVLLQFFFPVTEKRLASHKPAKRTLFSLAMILSVSCFVLATSVSLSLGGPHAVQKKVKSTLIKKAPEFSLDAFLLTFCGTALLSTLFLFSHPPQRKLYLRESDGEVEVEL